MRMLFLQLCNSRSSVNLLKIPNKFLNATRNYKFERLCFNNSIYRNSSDGTLLLNSNKSSVQRNVRHVRFVSGAKQAIQENLSPLQIKKRPARKKRSQDEEQKVPGVFNVMAYSTAEEYNLEKLTVGLQNQDLYEPKLIDNNPNAVHAIAKYKVGCEPREIFFFREGTVVLWNTTELESSNVLNFVKEYEQDSYGEKIVINEAEYVNYKYYTSGNRAILETNGDILLSAENNNLLEKYTFSNAMALSVKLGIWEASLDKYISSIEFVTEDLKRGKRINMSQEEVLRKHGELFALRHLINLSSDLLDTPDFYWDREQLEKLYSQLCIHYSIPRRTKVMNEKLNHCFELIELLSSHLSDRHHVRLEWMIIILIMVEVAFETLHYVERYVH